MRIVYFSSAIIPSRSANSIHVMRMCEAFGGLGHEVLLLAPADWTGEGNCGDVYGFYGVNERFEIRKLPWRRIRGRGYIYGVEGAVFAKKWSPDLVYGRFIPGCFVSVLFGLPVICESHFPVRCHGRVCEWMFRWMHRRREFQRLVVISNRLGGVYAKEYGLAKEMIRVAPDAANEADAGKSVDLGKGEKLRAGYVGHLYAGRGVELIERLAAECRWAEFHLIGGTEEDVRRWREQLRRMENVTVHGFVPPSETGGYRQACDVLLAPYQRRVSVQGGGDTSEWMSPLKIFEYMSAGKAIVCSDLPVLREVLTHGETGLLCGPEDVEAWKAALERLRDDETLRRRLGTRAREEYLAKHTWTARVENVLAGL